MSVEKVSIVYDERRLEGRPWGVRWYGEGTDCARPKRYCKSFGRKRDAESFPPRKAQGSDNSPV